MYIDVCFLRVLSHSYQRILIRNMANSRAYLKRIVGAGNNAEAAEAERYVLQSIVMKVCKPPSLTFHTILQPTTCKVMRTPIYSMVKLLIVMLVIINFAI